ncbi:Ras- protein Rab-2A [Tulasnella sp. 332]|nr:Ras- protein Rab-2A [Tulasnella sp. 332]
MNSITFGWVRSKGKGTSPVTQWDPSGSEQYKELRQKYYLGIDFFWLVYDVTDRASFEHIQDWVACARKTAPNSLGMYLVGNKSDLHDKRAVSTKEGIALAKKLILIWAGETSAKTNSGVQGLLGGWAPRMKQLEDV